VAFLSGIASNIVLSVLSALGGWLVRHFQEMYKDSKQKKADEAATQKIVDADKAAITPAERDNAAKGIADNL
jgi:hypothetical protein